MSARDRTPMPRVARRRVLHALAALGVLGLIAALHGRSLGYGWFMDDYAHQQQLRACDGSLRGLTEACRLELNGGIIELWWLPECTLRFFRPISFAWMKLLYEWSGWSPLAQHVACLGWHALACVLLTALLIRLGLGRGLAWAVAALFAVHPGHVATVQWIAAQTELMVTVFMLVALLAYVRMRGWDSTSPGGWGWAALVLLAFLLALGCRENAVMLPFVLLVSELGLRWTTSSGGVRNPVERADRKSRSALVAGVWVSLGAALVGYLVLRGSLLGGINVPPRPYIVSPSEPDFFRFVLDKTCYYLLGEFLLAPVVPIGGLAYLRERPLLFYGSAALLLAVLLIGWWRWRRRPAGWLGPACLFGFMAPVLPAFESPHHLYLPGVGWTVMAGLLLSELRGGAERVIRWRRALSKLVMVGSLATFGLLTYLFGRTFDAAQRVEDRVVAEVVDDAGALRPGDTLYFANLPMIAHYVRLAVEQRTGLTGLRAVALTWSPQLLGLSGAMQLDRPEPGVWELRVRGQRYFSGPARRLIAEAGHGLELMPGTAVDARDLHVEVIDADDAGVSTLRFRRTGLIDDGHAHFYWGSRVRWAQPLEP